MSKARALGWAARGLIASKQDSPQSQIILLLPLYVCSVEPTESSRLHVLPLLHYTPPTSTSDEHDAMLALDHAVVDVNVLKMPT